MIKKKIERFNETLYIIKLKNGMQVHILPKEDPYYSTYVELSIPFGALDVKYKVYEDTFETPYGTAHFLEHKVFAMPDGDAFVHFSKLGVDANAMTSYNQTSYLFMATERVMEALDYLLKMIDTPYYTQENVNNEKPIIAEELKMYLDDPHVAIQNQMMENLYHYHPIRVDIGGTLESIEMIDEKILSHVYQSYYQHKNRLITIAGKVDLKAIQRFFEVYDEHHQEPKIAVKTLYPKEPKRVVIKAMTLKKPISMDQLMIGFKLHVKKRNPSEQIKHETAMSMLLNILFSPSSPIHEKLLSEKLINQSFSVNHNTEKHAENIIFYAESKKVYKLKRILLDYIFNQSSNDLVSEAFDRVQRAYLGQFVFALNNLEYKSYIYGKYYHMGVSLFDVVDLVKEVTLDDVKQTLSFISPKYMSILIYKKA
ncbi:MAG: insulinase family protein [Acholeplasma sp.]|jgi:predicted Zn-dependent peptidase|nr:MAG: insulinase family protein [Acholeplasma sp.]